MPRADGGEAVVPQGRIVIDGTLCGCFEDIETLLCGLFCTACLYGQNRERAGLQSCVAATLSLLVPAVILGGIGYSILLTRELALIDCLQKHPGYGNPADPSDPCSDEAWDLRKGIVIAAVPQLLMLIYFWFAFARSRAQLQERLGQPVESAGNLLLYFPIWFAYTGPCALCQEGRAVKAAWQRNGMVPIVAPLPPIAFVGGATAYAQMPQ